MYKCVSYIPILSTFFFLLKYKTNYPEILTRYILILMRRKIKTFILLIFLITVHKNVVPTNFQCKTLIRIFHFYQLTGNVLNIRNKNKLLLIK